MKKISLFGILILLASCGRKTVETHPERKDITETVFASGTLEPLDKYNLTAQTEGYISELRFDQGDTVKAGQLLAVIDNKANAISASSAGSLLSIAELNASPNGPTLTQASENISLLKSKASQDSLQFSRYQQLFRKNAVSKLEFENAQLAFESSRTSYLNALQNYSALRQQLSQQLIVQQSQRDISNVSGQYNEVRAVVGGRVYKRLKETGDYIRRGDPIAVIGDAREMYARLSVDESNISKVKLNQEVVVQLNTDKSKNYTGYVSEIYPSFDEANQSFYCKVRFRDQMDFKIAGTQLQANIIVARKKQVLVIPRNFLGYGDKVKLKNGKEAQVKPGFVSGDYVEILDGLSDSSEIVTDKVK